MIKKNYQSFVLASEKNKKLLAILIDPEDFNNTKTAEFLNKLPLDTTHIFVGGSTVEEGKTKITVASLKQHTPLPIILFPGDESQITDNADALLFLSLLSGRNPEFLIGQQVKAVSKLKKSSLEIISTGYILINGGNPTAVAKVSKTAPMSQKNTQAIVDTALAGQYLGCKLIYLEAGSGAKNSVNLKIIKAVKKEINIPLIVGGGIKTKTQKQEAYHAGADMVVMGTIFETKNKV